MYSTNIAIKASDPNKIDLIRQFILCYDSKFKESKWTTTDTLISAEDLNVDFVCCAENPYGFTDVYFKKFVTTINNLFCPAYVNVGNFAYVSHCDYKCTESYSYNPNTNKFNWSIYEYSEGDDIGLTSSPYEIWKDELEAEASNRGIRSTWEYKEMYDIVSMGAPDPLPPEAFPNHKNQKFCKMCDEFLTMKNNKEAKASFELHDEHFLLWKIEKIMQNAKDNNYMQLYDLLEEYSKQLS